MSIRKGDKAPAFSLPARLGEPVDISADLGKRPIVLLFFPFAFSGVCNDQLCHFRDTWSQWQQLDAAVYGISVDSPIANDKWRADLDLPFPLLSDMNREVTRAWDLLHEDLKGVKDIARRAVFVIGPDGTVVYDWVGESPANQIPFDEVKTAVEGVKASA